jgi:type II secretory pathway component PulF
MPLFYYQAQNANREMVAGELPAASLAQAVAELESQGLTIQSIAATPIPGVGIGENPFADDNPARRAAIERAALEQHLARVIERGRELLPALRAYSQELPAGRRRRELDVVLQTLERGDAPHAARTLAMLPGYWIPLLAAATASRDPGRILREFVEESELSSELQRQWWLTLAYPALLGSLALAVLVALSVFVIPIFREIFTGFGLQLPKFTLLVLTIAAWISSGRILIWAAVFVAGCWLVWLATRLLPESLRNWWSDHFGTLWGRSTALARFAQFAADLLEAELPTPQAVRLAGAATGNAPIRRAAARVAGELESGGRLVSSGSRRLLTATILHALAHEAPPASRVRLLRELSACYAERARRRLSWTRGIVEPLAICAIGLVVGATVVALFLPLVSLVQGLS